MLRGVSDDLELMLSAGGTLPGSRLGCRAELDLADCRLLTK